MRGPLRSCRRAVLIVVARFKKCRTRAAIDVTLSL